ncbi:MAG: GIY-YIG nuclease family protein [Prevotellaceae bacterium]|jgi:putative endonuclease|nr:GIY-YIG nuclease family protein [Prevotellaceae bacterium]
MDKVGYIYIMSNKNRTTLYIGVTSNLKQRVWEHRTHHMIGSFTDKYNLEHCVYYKFHPDIESAISRETILKKWRRSKKEELINRLNPEWKDLWEDIKDWVM